MKRILQHIALLPAVVLLVEGVPAGAAGECLTPEPPAQTASPVGTLQIVSDRNLNGAQVELYRLQEEGVFQYYSYDITLREALTTVCAVPCGTFRLVLRVPTNLSFEWLEYAFDVQIPDPETNAAQDFSTVQYTIQVETDPALAGDTADTEEEPIIRDGVCTIERRLQLQRVPFELGDLDGNSKVNAADASQILMSASALGAGKDPELTSLQMAQADLDGDGDFDSADAADILIYAALQATGNFEGDTLAYARSAEKATQKAEIDD